MSDNREHALESEQNGERVSIYPKVAGTIQPGVWYRLRAVVRGNSIRVWLNGTLLFSIRDDRHTKGGIGLDNWMTSTRWRNLTVRDTKGAILMDKLPDPAHARQPSELAGTAARDSLTVRIAELKDKMARMPIAMSITEHKPQPRETRLFLRGDHRSPRPVVEPAIPAVLTASPIAFPAQPESAKTTGRRRILAQWLVSRNNPLTARVMVNRIWQYHFGRGLVETPSNFGLNGASPSHPDLLDWLAVEFMESSWSIQHMHWMIMSSNVYQQSSVVDFGSGIAKAESNSKAAIRNSRSIDPDNRVRARQAQMVKAEMGNRNRIALFHGLTGR